MNASNLCRRQFLRVLGLGGLGGAAIGVAPTIAAETPAGLPAKLRQAIAVANLDRARWRHIICHHSATPGGNAARFDRYHRDVRRMEHGLAYHFVIGNGTNSGDGQIEIGPRWLKQLHGGHVRSLAYNENSIGICLVGNFQQRTPTAKQTTALEQLITYLRADLLRRKPKLLLHREIPGEQTVCPGRGFPTARIRAVLD
jgi:hypothetical protein